MFFYCSLIFLPKNRQTRENLTHFTELVSPTKLKGLKQEVIVNKKFFYNNPFTHNSEQTSRNLYNSFLDETNYYDSDPSYKSFSSLHRNYRLTKFTDNVSRKHIDMLFLSVRSFNNFIFMKSFLRFILWSLNVPKHRAVFFWLRTFFKSLVELGILKNVSVKIKGKLAVTGNKRTRPFYIKFGVFSSTDNSTLSNFVVRTPTGIMSYLIKSTF